MIIPVRCFSCGSVVGEKYEEFVKRVKKGETPEKVMNNLGVRKYCCRRMIFSHVDFMEEIMKYKV